MCIRDRYYLGYSSWISTYMYKVYVTAEAVTKQNSNNSRLILTACQFNGLSYVLILLSLFIWLLQLWVFTYNFVNTFPVSLRSGFYLILFGLVKTILDILLFKFSSPLLAYRSSILPFLYNDFLHNMVFHPVPDIDISEHLL